MIKLRPAQHLGDTAHPERFGKGYGGVIFIDEKLIGMGVIHPKRALTMWEDITGISYGLINGEKLVPARARVKSRRVQAEILRRPQAHLSLRLKTGVVVFFLIENHTGAQVRFLVEPYAVVAGIPCLDDIVPPITPVPVIVTNVSVADEIRKLSELKDNGLITDEEFERQKSRLLE